MPNRGQPNLNGFERGRLKDLQHALAMGMDPNFAGSEIQTILGGAQQRVANRQAQMAPLTDALLQQAAAGAPAGAATALTNAYSAINPGLGGPAAQQRLGAFQDALYPQEGGTSPLYAGAGTEPLAPLGAEDYAQIDTTLQALIGQMKPDGLPYGVHEATMEVVAPLRAQGYDEPSIQRVVDYIHQRWVQFGGPTS